MCAVTITPSVAPWAAARDAPHGSGPDVRSLGRMLVVVDVRLAGVMLFLFLAAVVMAVGERAVIVLVRVPRRFVFPLAQRDAAMVMGDVVVVMRVRDGGMGVGTLFAFTFHLLWRVRLSTRRLGGLCWCSFCWLHAIVSFRPARPCSSLLVKSRPTSPSDPVGLACWSCPAHIEQLLQLLTSPSPLHATRGSAPGRMSEAKCAGSLLVVADRCGSLRVVRSTPLKVSNDAPDCKMVQGLDITTV